VALAEGVTESTARALLEGQNACLVLATDCPDKASKDEGLSAWLLKQYGGGGGGGGAGTGTTEPLMVYYLCLHRLAAPCNDVNKAVDVQLAWLAMLVWLPIGQVLNRVVKLDRVRPIFTGHIFRTTAALNMNAFLTQGEKNRLLDVRDVEKHFPVQLHIAGIVGAAAAAASDQPLPSTADAAQPAGMVKQPLPDLSALMEPSTAFRICRAVQRDGEPMWTSLLDQVCTWLTTESNDAAIRMRHDDGRGYAASLLELLVSPVSTPAVLANHAAVQMVLESLKQHTPRDTCAQTVRWIWGLLELAVQLDRHVDAHGSDATTRLIFQVVMRLSDGLDCQAAPDDASRRTSLLLHLKPTHTPTDRVRSSHATSSLWSTVPFRTRSN